MIKKIAIILLTFMLCISGQSLLNIKKAGMIKKLKDGRRIISGDVSIEYDVYKVKCDSAIVGKDLMSAKLYKNVYLQDTLLTITCDKADIYRHNNSKKAYFNGNVVIMHDDVTVYGKYANHIEIFNKIEVKDSIRVEYFPFPSIMFCKKLDYDIKKEKLSSNTIDSVFAADSLRYYSLNTRKAVYDLKNSELVLNSKFKLVSKEFEDTLSNFKDIKPSDVIKLNKKYKSFSSFTASKGKFNFQDNNYSADGNCFFTRFEKTDKDTSYFSCSHIDYSFKLNVTKADKNVSLSKGNLKMKTDYAEYHHDNDLLKLLSHPDVKFKRNTVTGDTIFVFMDKTAFSPEKASVISNAKVESIPDSLNMQEKDLMKGKFMDLWFDKEKLYKIYISKEAEIVYFIKEGEKTSTGSNYLLGDMLEVFLDDKGVTSAELKGGCEGIYFPDNQKMKALDKSNP